MNDVEEVKNRLDIVEVVGSYVPLKQAGRNFKGLSPFKTEKTPSFMVSAEKGIWHDFSSGKGGDVISFVMLMEGLEFREALEMLAKRAGVELKPRSASDSKQQSQKTKLFEALDLATKYYHYCLGRNKQAFSYLTKERSLKPSTIKHFKLGYSPDSWDSLKNFLTKRGFDVAELKSAGLVTSKQGSSSSYDVFRGRIMFPVFDGQNRAIGFSARILNASDKAGAKYINTPQTVIYDKSSAIYGYAQAKESIRKADKSVVVEGNMDVLALHNSGVDYAVAASGTALTARQLKTLSYLSSNVYLCFDNDQAGFDATQRAIEVATGLDVKLFVINLSGVKDAGELIPKYGRAAWDKAEAQAKYAPDYIVDWVRKRYDLTTALGKRDAAKVLSSMLVRLSDEIELSHYLKKCSQLLDVSEQQLLQKLPTNKDTAAADKQAAAEEPVRQPLDRQQQLELSLFELLLVQPKVRDVALELDLEQVSDRFRPYFQALVEHLNAKLDTIAKALPNKANAVKIAALRGEQEYSDLSEHDARLEAYTQLHRLQHHNIQLNKHHLAHAIADAEAAGDSTKAKKLLSQYQDLIKQES